MILRDHIISVARSYLGTPYRHQGRRKGPHGAIDCIGLMWCVSRELGFAIDIPNDYTEHPSGTVLIDGCNRHLTKPERAYMARGDIAIFYGWSRDEPSHYAIMGSVAGATRLTMIHAFSKRNQVVEHSLDEFWTKRLVTFYEFPGTEPA